jgi:hypothetical protein
MNETRRMRKLFEELHRFCQIDAAPTIVDEMDERTAVTVLCATAVLAHSRLMRAPDDPLAWKALRRVQLAREHLYRSEWNGVLSYATEDV